MTPDELISLRASWELSMEARRLSQNTIDGYHDGLTAFLRWSARTQQPLVLDKPTVNRFTADLLAAGAEATTARARHLAVRRFSKWLAEEGEIDEDKLLGMQPPKLDEKIVDPLTDEQLVALLKACAGKEFRDRRDEAIVRVAAESALRAAEIVDMTVSDTHVHDGMAVIRRGKGGKGREIPFSPFAAQAIDRYLRARRTHRLAGTDTLWLGERGRLLRYHGLYDALCRRAEMAGIPDFHPHRLRHTGATRWLEAGGTQDGLMAVAGWTTPQMLHRYVKATQSRRAAAEARRLNLGDL